MTGPINIGNSAEIGIRELAETVVDLIGSASKPVFCPLPKNDPKQRRPDIERARNVLGWTLTVGLREGLIKTIQYFEARIRLDKIPREIAGRRSPATSDGHLMPHAAAPGSAKGE